MLNFESLLWPQYGSEGHDLNNLEFTLSQDASIKVISQIVTLYEM